MSPHGIFSWRDGPARPASYLSPFPPTLSLADVEGAVEMTVEPPALASGLLDPSHVVVKIRGLHASVAIVPGLRTPPQCTPSLRRLPRPLSSFAIVPVEFVCCRFSRLGWQDARAPSNAVSCPSDAEGVA